MPLAATQRMLPAASRAGIRSVKIDMVVVLVAGGGEMRRNRPRAGFGNLSVRRWRLVPGSTKKPEMPQIRASGIAFKSHRFETVRDFLRIVRIARAVSSSGRAKGLLAVKRGAGARVSLMGGTSANLD